ncbi:MAG: cytochrome c [Acetobacteraceae bacterium]|nr:cytochrome c [Acetobacteraceae bacterium]
MRAALLLLGLVLLPSCDDMTTQPKDKPYRAAATGPGPIPADRVEFQFKPEPAPKLDLALIDRGQDRFRQFCTPCHSELGDGNGMIVQRGFTPPPNYSEPRLVGAPTQHFYDVITNGYGAMYSFAARVPPRDRWAIAAYIRALQRSNQGVVADLAPGQAPE